MLARILTSISICMSLTVAPAIASDWVEDDHLNGFYKHQINKNSGQPDPSYQPVRTANPSTVHLAPKTQVQVYLTQAMDMAVQVLVLPE